MNTTSIMKTPTTEVWPPEMERNFQEWRKCDTPGLEISFRRGSPKPSLEMIEVVERRFFDYLLKQVAPDPRPIAEFVRSSVEGNVGAAGVLGVVDENENATYCDMESGEFYDLVGKASAILEPFMFLRWLCNSWMC